MHTVSDFNTWSRLSSALTHISMPSNAPPTLSVLFRAFQCFLCKHAVNWIFCMAGKGKGSPVADSSCRRSSWSKLDQHDYFAIMDYQSVWKCSSVACVTALSRTESMRFAFLHLGRHFYPLLMYLYHLSLCNKWCLLSCFMQHRVSIQKVTQWALTQRTASWMLPERSLGVKCKTILMQGAHTKWWGHSDGLPLDMRRVIIPAVCSCHYDPLKLLPLTKTIIQRKSGKTCFLLLYLLLVLWHLYLCFHAYIFR